MNEHDENFNEAFDNDWDEEDTHFCICGACHTQTEHDFNKCDSCGKQII